MKSYLGSMGHKDDFNSEQKQGMQSCQKAQELKASISCLTVYVTCSAAVAKAWIVFERNCCHAKVLKPDLAKRVL